MATLARQRACDGARLFSSHTVRRGLGRCGTTSSIAESLLHQSAYDSSTFVELAEHEITLMVPQGAQPACESFVVCRASTSQSPTRPRQRSRAGNSGSAPTSSSRVIGISSPGRSRRTWWMSAESASFAPRLAATRRATARSRSARISRGDPEQPRTTTIAPSTAQPPGLTDLHPSRSWVALSIREDPMLADEATCAQPYHEPLGIHAEQGALRPEAVDHVPVTPLRRGVRWTEEFLHPRARATV